MYRFVYALYCVISHIILLTCIFISYTPFLNRRYLLSERIKSPDWVKPHATWIHCASLGETKGVLALIAESTIPFSSAILITVQTATAYSYLKTCALAPHIQIAIAPFDNPYIMNRFIQKCRPAALILYESELWPCMLQAAKDTPTILVSAIMRKNTYRLFSLFSSLTASHLKNISCIITQSQSDTVRFSPFHHTVHQGCDIKMWSIFPLNPPSQAPHKKEGIALCSLHLREWNVLSKSINMMHEKVYILPRTLSEITGWKSALSRHFKEYSLYPDMSHSCVLVDSFGKTEEILRYCNRAVIGGSFADIGIHSVWEALKARCTLYCGPYYHYQEELIELLEKEKYITILKNKSDTKLEYNLSNAGIAPIENVYLPIIAQTKELIITALTHNKK